MQENVLNIIYGFPVIVMSKVVSFIKKHLQGVSGFGIEMSQEKKVHTV